MDNQIHHASAVKTWLLVVVMVGIVVLQGWLAFTVVGDLGQPDWDYRPIPDVPGESPYAAFKPYQPVPYPQHVLGEHNKEAYRLQILPITGTD